MFKIYKDKKKMELLSKNTPQLQEIRNDVLVYKQKPIKIYDCNETEEKEI